jgi:phasin family protein
MPEKTEIEAEVAAEKAYAAAAEALTPKPAPVVAPLVAETKPEVEFPSKVTRAAKPKAAEPVAEAKPAPAAPTPAPAAKPAPLKAAVVRRAAAKKTPKKIAPAKQVIKPKPAPAPKITTAKIVAPKASAPKTVAQKTLFQQLKDKTVSTTDFTTKIKTAVTEAQTKAKEAFDKGAATFGEYNEFSKGNVEAVVASGKILAAGVQSLGKTFVDDGKTAFETLTAEVKELAAVKSPTDFFKLQVEFLRRNFDIAVANTSKNSEAVLKLASEAAAPISARVNLAV